MSALEFRMLVPLDFGQTTFYPDLVVWNFLNKGHLLGEDNARRDRSKSRGRGVAAFLLRFFTLGYSC